ncbi:MAG TPA: trypsin-like peptidase domain-containing protein [Longimicrobium sp.]|jgi:serine protease Do|uniref:trypsin-like peptidase domain-containing protein n=2 Tax=Longimicrobium sp. TaxID=2029185 RepID=UPI002ED87A11
MSRKSLIPALLILPFAAACGGGASANEPAAREDGLAVLREPPPARPAEAARLGSAVQEARRTAIVAAAERVAPAVVSVNVLRRERVVPRSMWEEMMIPPGAEREVAGLGSGFIITPEGLVITNEHVVRAASEVMVTLPDGREFDADVVGADEVNDLALLRIRGGRGLPVAPLGNSDGLMIGEWVIAIGNPFGFLLSNPEPSVSAGVVSAVGRNIGGAGGQRSVSLDLIQTDASINPGNSGGALVNALGEVVGVNSSILSSTGGSEGLGFAIPINRARRIALDLADDGRYRRAWIGADVEAVRAEGPRRLAEVRISQVVGGSPAERAGLRRGMRVVSIGAKRIRTPLDWQAGLLNAAYGEPLEVRVMEGGRERTIRVQPGDLPSMGAERIQALRDFQLVTLTPAIRAERGLQSEQGALIVGLSDAARQLGLREGDLILQINRVRVSSAEEAARMLGQLTGTGVVMYVEREGRLAATQFMLGS